MYKSVYFEEFINIPVVRASRRLRNIFFREALQPEGLSVQEWQVLLNLDGIGDTHLRELARTGHLDPTHVSRTARALEKRGLVRRYDDQKDTRRKRITTTKAGKAVIARVWPKALEMDARVRTIIGSESHQALRMACTAILEAKDLTLPPKPPAAG